MATTEATVLEALPKSAEEIVHAYIPDKKYAKEYVHRKVKGVNDFDLLDFCRKTKYNLLLIGPTGAGKTMFPMAYAADRNIPYFSVPCDISIEPTALFGKMMPTDTVGKFEWVDGPVTEMVRKGGVLNISEVNGMSPRISMSLFQLFDHRRSLTLLGHKGETIPAHPDLLVVADMNPNYRGTQVLNEAFKNRFPIQVPWGYNDTAEDKLVESKNLLDLVQKIRATSSITTPVGTNVMLEFQQIAMVLGMEFAFQNFMTMFPDNERQPVATVLDVMKDKITNDIQALRKGQSTLSELPELTQDPDWFVPTEEYDWEVE